MAERDEENHGGLSEAEARQRCVASGGKFASWDYFGLKAREVPAPAALADALLGPMHAFPARPYKTTAQADDCKPIVYERVGAFQQTMLRLIVQRLAPQRKMYLPGELGTGHIQPLPPPKKRFHIWCSRHNPGVRELIEEVRQNPRVAVFVVRAYLFRAVHRCRRGRLDNKLRLPTTRMRWEKQIRCYSTSTLRRGPMMTLSGATHSLRKCVRCCSPRSKATSRAGGCRASHVGER